MRDELTRPDNRVGPVVFSNDVARTQLLRGRVVTFRAGDLRTVGETHARWERNGTKQADVVIKGITKVVPTDDEVLASYLDLSGFESVEAWGDAIVELHGVDSGDGGFLYDVVLLDTEDGVERTDTLGYDSAGVWDVNGGDLIVTDKMDIVSYALCR